MKLTSLQMATFVAKGYLRFDGVVPEDLNQRLLERFSAIDPSQSRHLGDYYRKAMAERVLPVCDSGGPASEPFPAFARLSGTTGYPCYFRGDSEPAGRGTNV